MSRRPKFKPRIARVKLNPEQAVLVCTCYDVGNLWSLWPTYGNDMNWVMRACDPTITKQNYDNFLCAKDYGMQGQVLVGESAQS